MNGHNYWQDVHRYYYSRDIPRALVDLVSIKEGQTEALGSVLKRAPGSNVLEIGTFVGLSACGMALTDPTCNITTVDPNYPIGILGKRFEFDSGSLTLDYARDAFSYFEISSRINILEGFFSCITSTYLDRYVRDWHGGITVRNHEINIVADAAAEGGPYDLIFVDADHSAAAVYQDITAASRMLSGNGALVLDDIVSPLWGAGVKTATDLFLRERRGRFDIDIRGGLGIITKVNSVTQRK